MKLISNHLEAGCVFERIDYSFHLLQEEQGKGTDHTGPDYTKEGDITFTTERQAYLGFFFYMGEDYVTLLLL